MAVQTVVSALRSGSIGWEPKGGTAEVGPAIKGAAKQLQPKQLWDYLLQTWELLDEAG